MDYMTELAAIANKNGGIIETKTAAQRGISKAMLYKLCKAEKILCRTSCCPLAAGLERLFFPMKRRCSFTGFPTGHPLSTP